MQCSVLKYIVVDLRLKCVEISFLMFLFDCSDSWFCREAMEKMQGILISENINSTHCA